MNNISRKVKFSTVINTLKKKPIPMLFGFLFTLLPFFFAILFGIIFSSIGNDTPEINYNLINENGKEIKAEITNIETQYNLTINGVHPTIISYQYIVENNTLNSKYKVLEETKIEKFNVGSIIEIKELDGKTIIKNIEPYEFVSSIFLFALLPFLIIGILFLIYSLTKMNKELKLYKYGKLESGKIISMIPKQGFSVLNIGQGIIIHYEYKTSNNEKIIGESFTTDFSIISDKKKDEFTPIFVSSENEEKSCIVPKLQSLRNNWNIKFE